jgi:serine phosphatase RsbU (regulator of sigma subunit)
VLLGIDPGRQRGECDVVLDSGATLFLYTDGLVERRGQSLDEGLAHLRAVLEELASRNSSLDELCDGVLARLLHPQAEDDVALVAVRVATGVAAAPG